MVLRTVMLFLFAVSITATEVRSQETKPNTKESSKSTSKDTSKEKKTDAKPQDGEKKTAKPDQKKPETKKENKAVAEFDKKFREWKKVLVQLRDLSDRYAAANPDEQKKIRADFDALYKKGKAGEAALTKSAENATIELPDETKDHVRFLIARMSEYVQDSEQKKAISLGEFLIEQKIKKEEIYYIAAVAAFRMDDFKGCMKFLEGTKVDTESDIPYTYEARYKEAKTRLEEAKKNKLPRVQLKTTKGVVVIELFENEAPNTVANFISLVKKKFYNGLTFHRVLEGFMAQGGCPKGDGLSGPGYKIKCECYEKGARPHYRGVISMAHAGKDTGGSQFFITFAKRSSLDGRHTVFGRVIKGMDVVDQITRIDPSRPDPSITPVKIIEATIVRTDKEKKYEPETIAEDKQP